MVTWWQQGSHVHMRTSVLPACVSVHHVCLVSERWERSPGTGARDWWDPLYLCWEPNPVLAPDSTVLQEQVFLTLNLLLSPAHSCVFCLFCFFFSYEDWGVGDSKCEPHTCTGSPLSTEPSSQPLVWTILNICVEYCFILKITFIGNFIW